MDMALTFPQFADLPGVCGRILLANENYKLRSLDSVVSCSASWSITRAFIQAHLLDYVFMGPFLGSILWHDECATFYTALPGLEYALVYRAVLGRHCQRSERFLQQSSSL